MRQAATRAAAPVPPVASRASSAAAGAEATSGEPAPSVTESVSAVEAAAQPFPGARPIAPRTIGRCRPKRKLVAITLDDGLPFDTRILELFERRHLTATTFLLGEVAARKPDLVRRLRDDGFEIANHTWDHKSLAKLSEAGIRDELERCQRAISGVTGNEAPYMRPPGGATNERVRRVAASLGYNVVLWNKSFADTSKAATPERLYHNVMDGLKPGDIILCHWGGRSTYEAMELILPEMERRGYTPVTLSEMLADEAPAGAK